MVHLHIVLQEFGVLNSSNNPTLYFHRGFTYILENSTGGSHPFELRVTSGGSAYAPGDSS